MTISKRNGMARSGLLATVCVLACATAIYAAAPAQKTYPTADEAVVAA